MKYRLYIDEVGNPDLESSENPNHRYLSLTGAIIELEYVRNTFFPRLEEIKRQYFDSHPDEPVILHRKELVNQRPPFTSLRDSATERRFNQEILKIIRETEYFALTVVIDKLQHRRRYAVWRYDPYHYCLAVLIERYVLWLDRNARVGDVMAESRGGKEDRRLKESFQKVYESGTDYIFPEQIAARLTSKQLKVKPKANNVAGLQLADLIAHPAFKAAQARRNKQKLPENFGGKIASILEDSKYVRRPDGNIEGWGRKWLP
ncbi:MAG: DUF3800 domain-containing protein [Desulfobacteraceae bacterium]|nr:DUF3800 domain-containing protein [Desulfobacteraceae bacterium]